MESFQLSFAIVSPMFLMLAAGFGLRQFAVLKAEEFNTLNTLSFRLLLPLSLFSSIYNGQDLSLVNMRLIVWALLFQILILILLFAVVPRLFPAAPIRASIIQACFRSNFITFGIVIAGEFCSSKELAVVFVLAGILIPLYNVGGVSILEYYRGGSLSWKRLIGQIIRNPFVISCAAALFLITSEIRLPVCMEDAVQRLSDCSTPISFVALGGCLNLGSVRDYWKELFFGVLYRLIVQPAIFLGLALFLGFRGVEFLALTVMLISPTAVATYNMARNMGADGELAGYLVVFQSLGSMVSIFFWIYILSRAGLIG